MLCSALLCSWMDAGASRPCLRSASQGSRTRDRAAGLRRPAARPPRRRMTCSFVTAPVVCRLAPARDGGFPARARGNVTRQHMDRSTERLRTSPQSLRPAGVQGPGERGRDGWVQISIVRTMRFHRETLWERAQGADGCSFVRATLAASVSRSDIPSGLAISAIWRRM